MNRLAPTRSTRCRHIPLVASFFLSCLTVTIAESAESGLREDVLYGMRLEEVSADSGRLRVRTTGCEFDLGADGVVRCLQRIPRHRETLQIVVPADTMPFRLKDKNAFACRIESTGLSWAFQGDSVVILKATKETTVVLRGLFQPKYQAHKNGRRLFIDEIGGFGVYPVLPTENADPDCTKTPWTIEYVLKPGEELWLSVFPPREPNPDREAEHIAHEGAPELPYPSEKLIRSAARYCQVLVVHSYYWPGGDRAPWYIPTFRPKDRAKFDQLRETAHRHGMKLVPYFSPYYYKSTKKIARDDFVKEMKYALDELKVDGFYFDGISMDFRESYRIIRQARKLLGPDRVLHVHCSSDPLRSRRIYCPFIDTYADSILRGESGREGLPLDDFLRYTLSGRNISNAVGYWCYYGSTGTTATHTYVNNDPTKEHIDAAFKAGVRFPRTEIGFEVIWPEDNGHLDFFDRYYYGKFVPRKGDSTGNGAR